MAGIRETPVRSWLPESENRLSTRFLVKKSGFARSRYITSLAATRLTRTDVSFQRTGDLGGLMGF